MTKPIGFPIFRISIHAKSELKFIQPYIFKFQVGIEDSLHIEFEYNKARYHLDEAIIGKISTRLDKKNI